MLIYVFWIYYFIFFVFLYGFFVEKGGLRLQERGVGFVLAGRRKKKAVSLLLVALPMRHAQPALGQYLITSTAEQHAISY